MSVGRGVQVALFSVSLVFACVGYFVSKLWDCGNGVACFYYITRVGDPLYYGAGALGFVFLLLFLVPKAYSLWWKFAIVYIPLAILVFLAVPEPRAWISPYPAPEQVYQFVGGLYVLISFCIIAYAKFRK